MARLFTFDAAEGAHAALLLKGLKDSGVILAEQARECRALMEKRGLMHSHEARPSHHATSVKDHAKGTGVNTEHTDNKGRTF